MEIRRSWDRLISTMGFPILVRWHLYIESGPRFSLSSQMVVDRNQCFSLRPLNCLSCQKLASLYPPHNEVVGGVYWFHSVRPSVCPSVRPSVRPSVPHAVSALYHLQLWMDSFHIRHKWSLPWEGVSCTMTFDLDLYLQGHLALT